MCVCAKFTLENPPEWIQDICRHDQSMTMRAQRASRRSSMPINAADLPTAEAGARGRSESEPAEMAAELEKLKLQNKKGAR